MAKNKLKTHKGTKKVLNVRNSGSITIGHAGGRHNSGKKTTKTNRNKRGVIFLTDISNYLQRVTALSFSTKVSRKYMKYLKNGLKRD